MKDDPVPRSDHISRYYGGSKIDNGVVTAPAFFLREGEEYLSVNWLEYLKLGTRKSEVEEIRRVLSTKMNALGSTAEIGILSVEQVQERIGKNSPDNRNVRILHRPDEPEGTVDPSHSGIFDTSPEELIIAQLLVECILERWPSKE